MTITQLTTPLNMTTPLGDATCLFVWEWTSMCWWGCAQKETGEFWWWSNHCTRLETNISEGRFKQSPIKISKEMEEALKIHKKRYENNI